MKETTDPSGEPIHTQ